MVAAGPLRGNRRGRRDAWQCAGKTANPAQNQPVHMTMFADQAQRAPVRKP